VTKNALKKKGDRTPRLSYITKCRMKKEKKNKKALDRGAWVTETTPKRKKKNRIEN